MRRRAFLRAATAGASATELAWTPSAARGSTTWNMITSWPRDFPGPGTTAQRLANRITAMSDGELKVELFAAGELVPAFEVFDSVAGAMAEPGSALK